METTIAQVKIPAFQPAVFTAVIFVVPKRQGGTEFGGEEYHNAAVTRRCVVKSWSIHRLSSNTVVGGGFKYFFMFTPIWGRFPFWLICFTFVGSTNQLFVFCWWCFMDSIPWDSSPFLTTIGDNMFGCLSNRQTSKSKFSSDVFAGKCYLDTNKNDGYPVQVGGSAQLESEAPEVTRIIVSHVSNELEWTIVQCIPCIVHHV